MENATKALLISGGILIAMLILSIGVFLFTTYGDFGSSYEQTLEANEIKKFNSNFIKFEGRTDITAQEIISVINYVEEYKKDNDYTVEIKITGCSPPYNGDAIKFITNNTTDDKNNKVEFTCRNIVYNEKSGMIVKVEFIKNKS